jgi:hypothetical protein
VWWWNTTELSAHWLPAWLSAGPASCCFNSFLQDVGLVKEINVKWTAESTSSHTWVHCFYRFASPNSVILNTYFKEFSSSTLCLADTAKKVALWWGNRSLINQLLFSSFCQFPTKQKVRFYYCKFCTRHMFDISNSNIIFPKSRQSRGQTEARSRVNEKSGTHFSWWQNITVHSNS